VRPFITTLNLFVAVFGIIATKSASRGAMGIYLYLRSILVRVRARVCVCMYVCLGKDE
jgi:hypothetical protein